MLSNVLSHLSSQVFSRNWLNVINWAVSWSEPGLLFSKRSWNTLFHSVLYTLVSMDVHKYVCMYICMHNRHVSMHARSHICMRVRIVCMCVCV